MALDFLRGLTAADRTPEEQNSINQLMGRNDSIFNNSLFNLDSLGQVNLPQFGNYARFQPEAQNVNSSIDTKEDELRQKGEAFRTALLSRQQQWGLKDDLHDLRAEKYIDQIAAAIILQELLDNNKN